MTTTSSCAHKQRPPYPQPVSCCFMCVLLAGHGADVSVINEQGLWEEAAAGADPALVEELLSAGCPLPPGGVKQLVLWLRVPANAALASVAVLV
jgi:hypothetical protein